MSFGVIPAATKVLPACLPACRSKFISEFGSQSYPTFATYAEATAPGDWQVDNPMTGFRNRRWGGRHGAAAIIMMIAVKWMVSWF